MRELRKKGRKVMQLEFPMLAELPPENPIGRLEYIVGCVKESNKRVTRRLWAENRALKQMCVELEERLRLLEKNICSKNVM